MTTTFGAREAVIVEAVRTPVGKRKGALSTYHPTDLLALTLNALVERTGIDPGRVDDVIGGCVTQAGEQGCNVIRNGWVSAGLPQHVPATTVDRQCGSSQQAVHFAAQGVLAGAYDLVIACGVESMTRAKMSSNARGGVGPFSAQFLSHTENELKLQFEVAQHIADDWKITREDMDSYALESHRRAAAATDAGAFRREIVPVPLLDEEGNPTGELMTTDEGIRRGGSMEKLAGLPSAMANWMPERAPDITAGNSSQTNDGASAMLITTPELASSLGLTPRARFVNFTVGAESALWVLTAPNPVTRKAFARSGLGVEDLDAIEVNEAFASIALAWAREFLPGCETGGEVPAHFNPRGSGISVGHPLGASGIRIMTTLLHYLEDTGGRFGLQTMCEGGGQANVTILERLS